MHVSSFDTNTGDWTHQQFVTALPIGPELALAWLCRDNERSEEGDGTPCGPMSFTSGPNFFTLITAWTLGRQWFKQCVVLSEKKLAAHELESMLESTGIGAGEDEDGDGAEDEE